MQEAGGDLPRRDVLTSPATALSFDSARMEITISGELVVNMATQSFFLTPWNEK